MHNFWLRLATPLTLLATAGVFGLNMSTAATPHSKYLLYVGTYGKGIYGYRYDPANAGLEPLSLVGEVTNPSWVTTDPANKYVIAVSELEGNHQGNVYSFSIDHATGKLTLINSKSSEGLAPCHVSVDKTGRMLVVANYTSGNVASYPLLPDGRIGELASLMGATGTGPNAKRQEGPHAHEAVISANNERVYVPDLGLDEIRIYKIDPATAQLTTSDPATAHEPAGAGPRHIVFSPDDKFAYVISELKPMIDVFTHDPATGKLDSIQTISTAPENAGPDDGPAEVLITKSGKFVYGSNRGPGTIAVFSVDPATGKLTHIQDAQTGYTMPRGVEFDPSENLLFVGDQKTSNFKTFHIDHATGKLTPTGKSYEVPSPVSFVFVPTS